MKKLLVFALSFIVFQSCISLHNGHIAPNSVSVSTDNFQIVKSISGEAKALYILGIGGAIKEGLVREAKINMYLSLIHIYEPTRPERIEYLV